MKKRLGRFRLRVNRILCMHGGGMLQENHLAPSSDSLATKDYSPGGCSSHNGEVELKIDYGNIEEAELALREGGHLNSEEARALLGRLEYQRGNIGGALRVFDGIDFTAAIPKLKAAISKRAEIQKPRSRKHGGAPAMSMNAVTLTIEALFLKAKSLQALGRFEEAARSCNIVLDLVESALPTGLPGNFAPECKVQEMISKAAELLPELWKLGGFANEAVLSYRRVLLKNWNIDPETLNKIYKEFAIFLLYGGSDISSPNLRYQMEDAFIPKNSIEEAILVLMILLRRVALDKAQWDPTIIDHLAFALSVCGNLNAYAGRVEELLPGVIDRNERYYVLALSYLAEGDNLVALNLLKILLKARKNSDCVKSLLLAAKICGENISYAEEGVSFSCQALANLHSQCDSIESVANCLLGINLSALARSAISNSERLAKQSEALDAFEKAERLMKESDHKVLYNLALEYAEQRKLDAALHLSEQLLEVEARSNMTSWILLARILSAQKRYSDAEDVINTALEQTGKWDQAKLLRTKARIQVAEGKQVDAIKTYRDLVAFLLRNRSSKNGSDLHKDEGSDGSLETDTWHDLTNVYASLSRYADAQVCLSKLEAISPLSASRWHATGKLYEAKGLNKEAFEAYQTALVIEPTHVPSLLSAAILLKQPGYQSLDAARSYLTDALQIDRTNYHAFYHLGLLYKEHGISDKEAGDYFQAAIESQETAPAEPFR